MRAHPEDTARVGAVAELWRYPVKSLAGERVQQAEVGARGVAGDRLWSVRDPDGKFGSGKTTRRFRRMDGLLELVATYDTDVPVIAFPAGRRVRGDDESVHEALSAHVGRPVTLGREAAVSHFDEGPVHVLTTASLRALAGAHGRDLDPRRFRANILLDTGEQAGLLEDGWIGRRLAIGGEVVLSIRCGMTRCVMVDLAQVGLERESGLLRSIAGFNDAKLGVVADVERAGEVREGDAARLL